MAITSAISKTFKQEALNGNHGGSKTYKMALYTSAATIDANNNTYVITNEVSDANYTAGGASAGAYNVTLDGTVAILNFSNTTWTTATFTAMGCMIYSNNTNNNMVACFNFGGNVTGGGGNFTVNMPVANNTTGLIRIN